MGVVVVFTITVVTPRIGATATIGLLIAGQLAMGVLIDRYGWFGVEQVPLDWPRIVGVLLLAVGALLALRKALSHGAKVWVALWAVYIIWGSTYLGIELAGETIPPLFAVAWRFLVAGALMAGWVAWRRGFSALRVSRAELGSAALIGVLLPGANALLFVAEQEVPIGLASLVIASVPLLVVALRYAGGERPTRGSARRRRDRLRRDRCPRPAGRTGRAAIGLVLVVGSAVAWAVGSYLSGPVADAAGIAFAATALRDARRRARPASVRPARHGLRPGRVVDPLDRSAGGTSSSSARSVGYTAYVVAAAERSDQQAWRRTPYVNPVVAIALGAIVLHEEITWRIALGAAIVLASVAVVDPAGSPCRPRQRRAPAGAGRVSDSS